jgi:methionyl aminopeptidase
MEFVDKAADSNANGEVKPASTAVTAKSGGSASGDAPFIICATPGCGKPASMACPTCAKYGLPPSLFCGQECFKGYWGTHKNIHALVQNAVLKAVGTPNPNRQPTDMPDEFRGFRFTGPLRPCQLSPRRAVPESIRRPDYADHISGLPLSEKRDQSTNSSIKVYSSDEIERIRAACIIGREVLDIAGRAVRAGITCDEIDRIVHEATVEREAYPSPLNYHKFPKSVCTSVNEVICHGIPDMRELVDGDIVNIDISVYKDGYHADLNETFFVGNVDADSRKLVECAYNCLAAAVATVKPGTLYRDVGTTISKVAKKYKCSVVTTYCGHGIGELFHTSPTIPHYDNNKAKGEMRPGHIFTIEPMINKGGKGDQLWPDNWTAVTSDGSRSSQFEHTILVTETGCELLTARPGQPINSMVWTPEHFQR